MNVWDADLYHHALDFAAAAHHGQKLPGQDLPYILHPCAVAAEVMAAITRRGDVVSPDLAVACALLHDVVEDTPVTIEEVERGFGAAIAKGVAALSKNPALDDKRAKMMDSVVRIRGQPKEVWMVKLADRINNLREPPHYWSRAKVLAYREEAVLLHEQLASACPVLGPRLLVKIERYGQFAEGRD